MRRLALVALVLLGLVTPAAAQSVILSQYPPGRAAAASSLSLTLSTEDKAVVDAIAASLSVLDDWDESDRAKVNVIVGQAGIAAGAGAVGVTVPRVTLASDDPAVTSLQLLDNAVSGNGYNITQLNGVNVSMGNGASGTGVLRVTLASDSTGQVTLATGANVIGSLSANQSVNVAQINGVAPLMGNGASGTGAQRVTIANDSTGIIALTTSTASIGKLAANSGVIIGDVNVVSAIPGTGATSLGKAEDAAHVTGDTLVAIATKRTDAAASSAGTDGDYATLNTDASGRLWVNCGTGCEGGTQFAEDTAHVSGDSGTLGLAVRRDANTTLVDATGDYAPLQVDANGSLKVAIISGAGSGGTASQDNAAFTPGTTNFTPIGGEVDDTGTTAATENSAAAVRMTTQRAIHVNLRDASGNELSVGGGTQYTQDAALTVATSVGTMAMGRASAAAPTDVSADNDAVLPWYLRSGAQATVLTAAGALIGGDVANGLDVDVTRVSGTVTISGTVTANAGTNLNTSLLALESGGNLATIAGAVRAEDAASADAHTGIGALAVRKAAPANTSGTDGDYEFLQMSAGRLWTSTTIDTALPAGTNAIGKLAANDGVDIGDVTINNATLAVTQSGAPWAENVTQFGSTNLSTGTGTGGAGIPRVTVSSDSTLTSVGSITNTVTAQGTLTNNNAAPSTNNIGALVARATASAPTYTEGNLVALSTDNAGALRVSGSSGGGVAQTQVRDQNNAWQDVGFYRASAMMPVVDQTEYGLLQQLITAVQQTAYLKGSPFGLRIGSVNDALKVAPVTLVDPCSTPNKGNVAVSQTTTTRVIAGMPGSRIYVCAGRLIAGAAEILSITEGTGAACATGESAVSGSATAANGESYAANGGFQASGGLGAIMIASKPGDDVCVKQNGSNRVSGNLVYAYGS